MTALGKTEEPSLCLQQMLKDCDDGKIEVIYTKSVCQSRTIANPSGILIVF